MTAGSRERLYAWTTLLLVLVTWATLYWARFAADWLRARGWVTATMLVVFLVAVLAVLVVVARSRPGPLEIVVLVVFAALYAAAVLPLAGQPEEALHFVQYGAVGGFAYGWFDERRRRLVASASAGRRSRIAFSALAAFLFTTAAGWIDEGIQYLLPNRYYDLRDVAFNAAAGALAIAAMLALRWARRRRSRTPSD